MRSRKWDWFDLHNLSLLPRCPAVYAIYADDELRYIGSTANLRKRIGEHNVLAGWRWSNFGHLSAKCSLSTRQCDWLTRERRLINRINPPDNGRESMKRAYLESRKWRAEHGL